MSETQKLQKLLSAVFDYYAQNARKSLPWRNLPDTTAGTRDPYKILVSEIMLQQTQAQRVIPFYERFIKEFPDAPSLANAPLSRVLTLWSGLGYNRRGKYLHDAVKIMVRDGFAGKLPGVGPYTRAAVEAFAHNKPEVFIETNIRTVFTHLCFANKYPGPSSVKLKISRTVLDTKKVSDTDILPLIEKALALALKKGIQPRDFYAALMDYGAHLKQSGVRINNQSKHYTKQSKFIGSARQLRGALLRELLKKPASLAVLSKNAIKSLPKTPARKSLEIENELAKLQKEGMVAKKGSIYSIAHKA